MQIRFTADLETGEASISDKMMKQILELSPLMWADLFKDITGMASALYEMALDDMRLEFEGKRNASTTH